MYRVWEEEHTLATFLTDLSFCIVLLFLIKICSEVGRNVDIDVLIIVVELNKHNFFFYTLPIRTSLYRVLLSFLLHH